MSADQEPRGTSQIDWENTHLTRRQAFKLAAYGAVTTAGVIIGVGSIGTAIVINERAEDRAEDETERRMPNAPTNDQVEPATTTINGLEQAYIATDLTDPESVTVFTSLATSKEVLNAQNILQQDQARDTLQASLQDQYGGDLAWGIGLAGSLIGLGTAWVSGPLFLAEVDDIKKQASPSPTNPLTNGELPALA